MNHPTPRVGLIFRGALALALLTLAAGARAEGPGHVERLMADVARYDLKGDRTFKALRYLEPHALWNDSPRQQLEVGLLRATASIDILLIARMNGDQALEKRLAQTHDVTPDELAVHLSKLLDKVDQPLTKKRVALARATLAQLAHGARPTAGGAGHTGAGGNDVMWLLGLGKRLKTEPAADVLADMSDDPCANEDSECDERYSVFGAAGRRAVAGLERAARVAHQIENPETASPLVVALRHQLKPIVAQVEDLSITPSVRLEKGPACSTVGIGGRASTPDVLAFISENELRYGFAPRAQIGADGAVELLSVGQPQFPETRTVKLPGKYPQYLKRITAASEAFAEAVGEGENLSIGLCASRDTPAHVWARGVLSARHAGFTRPYLLGLGEGGGARTLDVDVVAARRADKVGRKDLSVMVRIGGYSVRRGKASATIPRIQRDDGKLRFDLGALVQHAQPAKVDSAKLHFMPDVASSTLLSTAFAIAPTRERLTVILP